MNIDIRPVSQNDLKEWLKLRQLLWPDCSAEQHELEIHEHLTHIGHKTAFVAELNHSQLIGFVEATLRERNDGASTPATGYLEGWYLLADYHDQRIEHNLIQAVENWAREHNCVLMACDIDLSNKRSLKAHKQLGYKEQSRLAHLTKTL